MPDREKIILAIDACLGDDFSCSDCYLNGPGFGIECRKTLLRESLALLKEQKAVEPITARKGRNKYWSYYICPNCNEDLNYGQKYCCECGKKVKWDA